MCKMTIRKKKISLINEKNLIKVRQLLVGKVFRYGLRRYQVVAVESNWSHPNPKAFGMMVPANSYLIECREVNRPSSMDFPYRINGHYCYCRVVE